QLHTPADPSPPPRDQRLPAGRRDLPGLGRLGGRDVPGQPPPAAMAPVPVTEVRAYVIFQMLPSRRGRQTFGASTRPGEGECPCSWKRCTQTHPQSATAATTPP